MWAINWLVKTFTKSHQMASNGDMTSSFWRIAVTDGLDASAYNDDEAATAATEIAVVLRRTAVASVPLQAYVFNHKYTDPAFSTAAGVTSRWREPSHYDIHGLVHLQGISLSEHELRENLLDTIRLMDDSYLTAYHSWSFVQLSEQQYSAMYEDDLNRAL